MSPTLDIDALSITYGAGAQALHAVRDVSLRIMPGEAYGLIGESGSGKTSIAYAVMRYLGGGTAQGRVFLAGQNILALPEAALRGVRGRVAAMVYQDPMSALNPAIRVGEQIAESLRLHGSATRAAARAQSIGLLDRVHLPDPDGIARRYPHQLSGGQQQRVVIAMALACNPRLLIMDEPTTGLDVTTEAVILDLVRELRQAGDIAVLFISHNMGVIAQVCDRVGVLYAGQLVEEGATAQVLRAPCHPYTSRLMGAMPSIAGPRHRLEAIPGGLPDLRTPPAACIFEARCDAAAPPCSASMPALGATRRHGAGHLSRCHFRDDLDTRLPPPAASPAQEPAVAGGRALAQIVGLEKTFLSRPALALFSRRAPVRAVDGVTLEMFRARTLAVVGESGSGKSTLARCVAGLVAPDSGDIRLSDHVVRPFVQHRTREQQRSVQFIFQNPDAALNPHWTVEQSLGRSLKLFGKLSGAAGDLRRQTIALLEMVNLGERYLPRFPREMSGGEKQRLGIARAFAGKPRLVICDEPTSALDVSVQAAILNQLIDLQRAHGTSYLFISHDLGVVRHVAHHVAIMQRGRIVETGETAALFEAPQQLYTRALIGAVPGLNKQARPGALPAPPVCDATGASGPGPHDLAKVLA